MPATVADLLRTAAAAPDMTIAEVILDALEATKARHKQLVDAERPQARGRGAFPDRRPAPRAAEPRVTVPLNTTQGNLDVITRMVDAAGAHNRSQLIAAALRAHLGRTD